MEYDEDYTGATREPEHSIAGISRPFIGIDAFDALTIDDATGEQSAVRVVGIRDDGADGFEFIVLKIDGSEVFVGTETTLFMPDEDEPEAA